MMDTPSDAKETLRQSSPMETNITDMEKIIGSGFTAEETASLLWLQKWYQTGGSDRVALVRHWEFLRLLVLTGKLDV